jgi:WD40 repeat protein
MQPSIGTPLNGHTSKVVSFAFTHDGAFRGSYDTTIRVWNVETGIEAGEPLRGHTSFVASVACSPDSLRIVSGSWDESVRLWNIANILAKSVISQKHDNSANCELQMRNGMDAMSGAH